MTPSPSPLDGLDAAHGPGGGPGRRGGWRSRVCRLWLWLLLLGMHSMPPFSTLVSAAEESLSEQTIMAAFIHKFATFVNWPDTAFQSTNDPLVLTVLGTNPFGPSLEETLANISINGRQVVIQHVRDERHLTTCHLLFISPFEEDRLNEILKGLEGKHVLTVSQIDGFCSQGGMINLVRKGRHLRFEINPEAAGREQLKISSQLLKLATIVKN